MRLAARCIIMGFPGRRLHGCTRWHALRISDARRLGTTIATSVAASPGRFGDAPLPGERTPERAVNRTATELLEYFAGKRRVRVPIPLAPAGTLFQLAVWRELERIPYGETLTTADARQAAALGQAVAPAVGNAVHRARWRCSPDHRIVEGRAPRRERTAALLAPRRALLASPALSLCR